MRHASTQNRQATAGWRLPIGARPDEHGVHFRVWAPHATRIDVRMDNPSSLVALTADADGYHSSHVSGLRAGARYRYVVNGTAYPDPASRSQPDGVHGPSAVIEPGAFAWTDDGWAGIPLPQLIVYELHVGTFTRTGTFEAIIPYLKYLRRLGITAIELMPVAQFPGRRNWGYDGVGLYAPQCSYGGPEGLKQLVDACHAEGLGVLLDVVYNHVGPEGNYLDVFGPYFTDRYRTPWGRAINYDGADSDAVRAFVVDNARYWINEYHLDGLRLDAIHGIFDFSARHILQELADAVRGDAGRLGRQALIIAESDLNDPRVIQPSAIGGHGLDAQWSDDFHHALHALLTGERAGYYEDFGRLEHLARAYQDGFVYRGQRSAHRRRTHGAAPHDCAPSQLVVCAQNHDQVGNRALGERLGTLVPAGALRVAAAAVLLAPNTPLLFMGEEYGETAPFQYFIDHEDPGLVESVRKGRRAEFAAFGWSDVPDPADPATFERSRLALEAPGNPLTALKPEQQALFRWYGVLLDLRKTVPALGSAITAAPRLRAWTFEPGVLVVHRWADDHSAALLLLNLSQTPATIPLCEPHGHWTLRLTSSTADFGGSGEHTTPANLSISDRPLPIELLPYQVAVYLSA